MYTFTNRYGDAVPAPDPRDLGDLDASDIRNLPLWIAAANAAEVAGYCDRYDEIAESVGGPTRQDLKDAGLIAGEHTVTLTRRVPVQLWVNQQVDVVVTADNREAAEVEALRKQEAGDWYWPSGMYANVAIENVTDRYHYADVVTDLAQYVSVKEVSTD